MEKFYSCKYDRAFKEVFLKENNKEVLKAVLESCLKVKINEIEIINTEMTSGNINIRRKILDAHLKTDQGEIDIEVNACNKDYIHPRNMAYICNQYTNGTLKGEEYNEDTNHILIDFTYGLKEEKEYCNKYYIQTSKGKKYVKNFEIQEYNMDKYLKIWYDKDKKGIEDNKYLIMMGLELEDLRKLSEKDEKVKKYMEEIEKVNKEPVFVRLMSEEEDKRKIHNSLMAQERREGKEEGKQEIALNMLNKGLELSLISEVTGLTKEEIENLK